MGIYEKIETLGLLTSLISGLVMILILIFGSPHYPMINGFRPNPVFDASVLFSFVGLLVFGFGAVGKDF